MGNSLVATHSRPHPEGHIEVNSEDEWTVYRTRFLVRACQLTKPMVFIDALGREHSGEPGDYLVESSEGWFRITSRKIFEDVYVPLAAPQPNARETPLYQPDANPEATGTYTRGELEGNVAPCSA
jgi:hypothetical protein